MKRSVKMWMVAAMVACVSVTVPGQTRADHGIPGALATLLGRE